MLRLLGNYPLHRPFALFLRQPPLFDTNHHQIQFTLHVALLPLHYTLQPRLIIDFFHTVRSLYCLIPPPYKLRSHSVISLINCDDHKERRCLRYNNLYQTKLTATTGPTDSKSDTASYRPWNPPFKIIKPANNQQTIVDKHAASTCRIIGSSECKEYLAMIKRNRSHNTDPAIPKKNKPYPHNHKWKEQDS